MATGRPFHVVDTAQHRGLAAAARSDDRGLVATVECHVDTFENLKIAEALVKVLDP